MGIIWVGEIGLVIRGVLKQLLQFVLENDKVHDTPTHVLSPPNVSEFVV